MLDRILIYSLAYMTLALGVMGLIHLKEQADEYNRLHVTVRVTWTPADIKVVP